MLKINVEKNDDFILIRTEGRIDSSNSLELQEKVGGTVDISDRIIFDLEKTEYVSSAGLRIFLSMQKKMNAKKGSLIFKNISPDVKEVFEITGYTEFLTIE